MEIIYRASDGTEFNDKKECQLYEKNLEKKTKQVYETYEKNLEKKVSEIYKKNLEKIAAEKDLEKRARQNMDSSISLECTSCGTRDNTRVLESRSHFTKSFMCIRRRRECLKCSNRFNTYEINLDQFSKYDTKELYDLIRDRRQNNEARFCLSCEENDYFRVCQSRERKVSANYFIERVRECLSCSQKFSTLELKLEKNFTLKKIDIPIKYYASDLTEFNNEDERNLYEKNLEEKEKLEQIKENPEVENYIRKATVISYEGDLMKYKKNYKKKDSIDCYKKAIDCYKKAIDYYQKAIELDDKNPDLYCRIGDEKNKLEEYKEAIDYYQKAIELGDKELGFCNYQIGFCKFCLKKYQEAIVYFLQAIILNFDHSKCYLRIGICKELLKKDQEAIDYYQKAIELNYDDPELCNSRIGSRKFYLKKYKEAIDYYQKAIEWTYKDEDISFYNMKIKECRKLLEKNSK